MAGTTTSTRLVGFDEDDKAPGIEVDEMGGIGDEMGAEPKIVENDASVPEVGEEDTVPEGVEVALREAERAD